MNWEVGQIVILNKKKKNGYPKGREIGEELIIDRVMQGFVFVKDPKSNINGKIIFKLHESYLMNIAEYREKIIDEILIDER